MSIIAVHPFYIEENQVYSEPELIHTFYQEEKNHLIETVSQQLRQNILLKEYEALTSDIVVMKSKLDVLRMDMTASIKAMHNKGELSEPLLTHFEKKLESHQSDLTNISYHHPLTLSSFYQSSSTQSTDSFDQEKSSERNALDDTLSFLDTLSVNTDNDGYRQDLLKIIDNYTSPEKPKRKTGFFKKTFTALVMILWHWIKFSIIMTLAILISFRQLKNHSCHH